MASRLTPVTYELVVTERDVTELDVIEHDSSQWSDDEYVKVVSVDAPTYEGPYEATPSWSEQTFDTANHLMLDDFAIRSIQQLEVSNTAGGLTLTI